VAGYGAYKGVLYTHAKIRYFLRKLFPKHIPRVPAADFPTPLELPDLKPGEILDLSPYGIAVSPNLEVIPGYDILCKPVELLIPKPKPIPVRVVSPREQVEAVILQQRKKEKLYWECVDWVDWGSAEQKIRHLANQPIEPVLTRWHKGTMAFIGKVKAMPQTLARNITIRSRYNED